MKLRLRLAVVMSLALAGVGAGLAREDKKPGASDKGQVVFTCGHSFHVFMPGTLNELAKLAKIKDHKHLGTSGIGGSRVIQHWDVEESKNKARAVLKEGKVDVLTLSPIHLPDDGIEKFVTLAVENNPKVRVLIQANWLPFDIYDKTFKVRPKDVDHDAPMAEGLKKLHKPYFDEIDDHARELNKKLKTEAVRIAPVGQAVVALREKILDGKAPGLKKQSDLFTDAIGHAKPPIVALSGYVYFALVYRRTPVGLPMPNVLSKAKGAEYDEKLNRLLQELAWEAVTKHPLSGVK